jgi:gliding motility-associated-like protein
MIVTKTTNFRPLRLYSNNGVGNFSLQQLCLALDGAGAVSDINNDGKLDIAYWSVDSKKTFVVYQVPTIDSFKQDSICMGKTYRLPTGRIVSVAGIYLDTFRSNIGCDSIRFTTNLKVIPLTIPINRTICSNDSIKINGKWYSQRRPSGRDTLKTVGSCDSVFIVNLSFKPPTDAIDDNVIVNETNVTEFTVTDNDRFDASAQLNIRLLKKPQYGTLTALGNDKFRYESLPILRGVTQMFTYLLCNTLCPNECDSAQVTIDIQGLSPVVKNSKGITPQNHDGKNDVLEFDETEDLTRYPESELIIYNRWNDIVFRAKPYLNNWDGSRNGQPLPAGTYYYILHLNQREGKTLTGDVTIIR